jgi:hypothetical protein
MPTSPIQYGRPHGTVYLNGTGHEINCILEVSVIASEWEVHAILH